MQAMTEQFLVRRARASDLERLWLLRTEAIRAGCAPYYPAGVVAAWADVQQPAGFATALTATEFLVAEMHDGLVGFGFWDPSGSRIEALFVAPSAMRVGIGSALVRNLEESARSVGASRIDLQSTLNAEQFYARLGYAAVRRTVWQHPAGFELPCVDMSKTVATA